MKTRRAAIRLLLLTLAVALPGALLAQEPIPGATHFVDNVRACEGQVPCHATIMEAVQAAAPYDSIRVFPGVYHEAVVFDPTKHHVVLQAHAKALMPVIVAPAGGGHAVTLDAPGVQVLSFVLEAAEGAGVLNKGPNEIRDGATDTVLHGNLVKASRGIVFSGCLRSRVTSNSVQGGGITIDSGSTRACWIEGNEVDGASIWSHVCNHQTDNVVRRNVVRRGDVSFACGEPSRGNTIESNRVEEGSISLGGTSIVEANLIRRNLVRGGRIFLGSQSYLLSGNTVELNFVSGSAADGIWLRSGNGGTSLVRKNTSVENAGCDIRDTSSFPSPYRNTWTDNRFGTKCGDATG